MLKTCHELLLNTLPENSPMTMLNAWILASDTGQEAEYITHSFATSSFCVLSHIYAYEYWASAVVILAKSDEHFTLCHMGYK